MFTIFFLISTSWGQTCILKPNPWKALLTKPKSWDTVRVKDCENYLAY